MSDLGVSAAFRDLGADPYGGWEEEPNMDYEIDLDNILSSSQEAAMEILHENNNNKMTDEEYEQFLEDTFVLPVEQEEDEDDSNIFELIDVACDAPRKSEEFSDAAMDFIANPKNEKSAKVYNRYQNDYVKYCKQDTSRNETSQTTLVNYFSMIASTGRYSPGTMWCIYSCLKSYIMVKYNINIKCMMLLRKCIKRITQDHLASKPDIFLFSEIKLGLTTLFDEDNDKDLLQKVGISIMYFGVLRRMEILLIQIKDVTVKDLVNVEFPYKTKRRVKGFRFKLPEWLVATFLKYIGQFKEGLTNDCRFMRNFNQKSKKRVQNMGEGQISKFAVELAQRLEKDDIGKYTAKSFRRSAATQLVEAGISIVGLCEAGNWKSTETAREYTEHSTISTENRMNMLDGKKRSVEDTECTDAAISPFKKQVSVLGSPVSTTTNNNCTIINISNSTLTGLTTVASLLGTSEVVKRND